MSFGLPLLGLAFGLMLVCEGLVLALAPKRIEDMLDLIRRMTVDQRRSIGLLTLASGVLMIWLASGTWG